MQEEDRVNRNVESGKEERFHRQDDDWYAATYAACQGLRWVPHSIPKNAPDGNLAYNCDKCGAPVRALKSGPNTRFLN